MRGMLDRSCPERTRRGADRSDARAAVPKGLEGVSDRLGNRALLASLRSQRAHGLASTGERAGALEREADFMAERALRSQEVASTSESAAAEPKAPILPAGDVSELVPELRGSPGRPLDASSRSFFEARFGRDFSNVLVHADSRAGESARSFGAAAYALGTHVVFADGRHRPGTAEGRELLAHELAHVVQQSDGRAEGIQRQPDPNREPPSIQVLAPQDLHVERIGVGPKGDVATIKDAFVSRTEKTYEFNRDEELNTFTVTEYGHGWIRVGGGREQRVEFVTETTSYDSYRPGREFRKTVKQTRYFVTEYVTRPERAPIRLVESTHTETESFHNVPKHEPVPESGGGVLSKVGGFFKGVGKSLWGLAEGLYHVVRHPIQTVEGLYQMVRHPIRTLTALGHAIKERGKAILSGDFEALGRTVGDVAILLLAPEAEAAEGLEAVEAAGALEAARVAEGASAIETAKLLESAQGLDLSAASGTAARGAESLVETAGDVSRPALARGGEGLELTAAEAEPTFTLHVGSKRAAQIQAGERDFVLDRALTFDVDEILPVGAKDIKAQRAVQRARDPFNRQLLDPLTNQRTKGLGVDPRSLPSARAELPTVSLADQPAALVTRTFGEIREMRTLFDRAEASVRNIRNLKPTEIKARINKEFRRLITEDPSAEAAAVRSALQDLGFQRQPDVGWVLTRGPGR